MNLWKSLLCVTIIARCIASFKDLPSQNPFLQSIANRWTFSNAPQIGDWDQLPFSYAHQAITLQGEIGVWILTDNALWMFENGTSQRVDVSWNVKINPYMLAVSYSNVLILVDSTTVLFLTQ